MIRNLCVKDVKMMFLQVSSDVTEKGILVSVRKMKQEIFINVYAGLMKATHVWRKFICYFYEGNPDIHSE